MPTRRSWRTWGFCSGSPGLGLLAAVVLHIVCTVQLTVANRLARQQPYGVQATRKATRASRTMIWSGTIILVFVIYHLMQLYLGDHEQLLRSRKPALLPAQRGPQRV